MTRAEFIAVAAIGITGLALQSKVSAELLIASVTPASAEEQGFTVKVSRPGAGLLRFEIIRVALRQSRDEVSMRLAIGRKDEAVVVCFLEPKRVEVKGDPVFRYTFDLGEKSLKDTTLDLHEGGRKQLGGTVHQFDLAAFAATAGKPAK